LEIAAGLPEAERMSLKAGITGDPDREQPSRGRRSEMEKVNCKLTDEHNRTCNNTQWGENVTYTAPGTGDLCTGGWIHYYDSPLLAVRRINLPKVTMTQKVVVAVVEGCSGEGGGDGGLGGGNNEAS